MQRSGLEWVWRMLEERRLIKRYWHDGVEYLKIIFNKVLPYRRFLHARKGLPRQQFSFERLSGEESVTFALAGDAEVDQREIFRQLCADAMASGQNVTLDCRQLNMIDASCLGLLQLLESRLAMEDRSLQLTNVSPLVRQVVIWNLVEYLL
jgi:N-acetylglucosaminyldiphosphoundecaprenol N-acetyl-beta-D-mannosaminyltransferase